MHNDQNHPLIAAHRQGSMGLSVAAAAATYFVVYFWGAWPSSAAPLIIIVSFAFHTTSFRRILSLGLVFQPNLFGALVLLAVPILILMPTEYGLINLDAAVDKDKTALAASVCSAAVLCVPMILVWSISSIANRTSR
jgi:hypothetical protein